MATTSAPPHPEQQLTGNTMSTPLNNLPLNTNQKVDSSELQDPMVQDVLKEFEEEIAAAKRTESSLQQPLPQQPLPQQLYPPQNPNIYQQYNNMSLYTPEKRFINYENLKKSAIIGIICILVFYPCFKFIYNRLPDNISGYFETYDVLFKGLILIVILYMSMYFNIIEN